LAATSSKLFGLTQTFVAAGALALSVPFTVAAWRAHSLNYRRAVVYHVGLLLIIAAGVVRAFQGVSQTYEDVLATGVVLLIAIALSNSWQLVLTHESDEGADPRS
jgi:uncharacterized membrane protein YfcA